MRESALAKSTLWIDDAAEDPSPSLHSEGLSQDHSERMALRMLEALLFAATGPLDDATLESRLPEGSDLPALLERLEHMYSGRGITLVRVAGRWALRTAPDLAFLLREHRVEPKRLSRAALETMAIIAYHQPVTRAEIEEIRGVSLSKGTLDVLLETGWISMRGRRRTPGRPVTYGTTDGFLEHFGLAALSDLPGLDDLRAAGLFDRALPPDFTVPSPSSGQTLLADEDPLEAEDLA
jgi:segregation and condensation protein B